MKPMNDALTHERPQTERRRRSRKAEVKPSVICLNRDGEWMGSDELKTCLLAVLTKSNETVLDLDGLTHVDAANFQVIVSAAQTGLFAEGRVRLTNVSQHVRRWFEYAGAEMLLASAGETRP